MRDDKELLEHYAIVTDMLQDLKDEHAELFIEFMDETKGQDFFRAINNYETLRIFAKWCYEHGYNTCVRNMNVMLGMEPDEAQSRQENQGGT